MPKLRCDAKNCIYNCEKLCTKSLIHINNDAEAKKCETFSQQKFERNCYNTEFANMEDANTYVSIDCMAKDCDYNNNGICVSENVKIGCDDCKCCDKAKCETFSL